MFRKQRQGCNIGPEEIHRSIDGGASKFQMELMGGGHHPRCQHYEYGPCTCDEIRRRENPGV